MLSLCSSYSLIEIITFIIVFAIAIKEIISYFDWGKNKIDKEISHRIQKSKNKDELEERLEKYDEDISALKKQNEIISNNIQLLLASDRDDIKAWITSQHHYFCYELKYLDNFSRDCLEKRYGHYVEEGGNSFIENFMNDLRALPDSPPEE